MSTVAIANQAGSAGKTTTAVTLAALLAAEGRTVRVLDLDGQGNASVSLGHPEPTHTTGDVLLRDLPLVEALIDTLVPGLQLLPADRRLDQDAVELSRALGGEQRLRRAIEAAPPVDVTLIDCPGALGILTVTALVAADTVVTVATPTVKEIAGIPPLEQTVDDVAGAYNPKLRLGAVIPCAVPPASAGALYSEALQLLRESYGDLVAPSIRRSVRVPEAYSRQVPLPVHAPHEAVTEDYRAALAYLIERGLV